MLKKLVLIVILVSCWPLNSLAEPQALSITGLLEKSGVNAQIAATPQSIKLGLKEAVSKGAPLSGDKLALIEDAIDKAYAENKVGGLLHQRVEHIFSDEELQKIAAFLESPLGKRIVEAENKLTDEKEMQKTMENAAKLVNEGNKNPARLGLIQSITEAMSTTDKNVNYALSVALALDVAMINATPSMEMPPMEELVQVYEANRFLMTGKVAQIVLAAGVHVYRPFSNAELNQYLEFALSPVGNKYFTAIGDALIEILSQCGEDMGKIVSDTAI